MTDRAEVSSAAVGTLSLLGTVVSVLTGLGLLTVLFSVIFGSALTYMVQSRTQKSGWRREGGLRKIDSIYGPLYNQVNSIGNQFVGKKPFPQNVAYYGSEAGWPSIKDTYLYFLIPEHLRVKLESFFESYATFQRLNVKLFPMIDSKLLPEFRSMFGSGVIGVDYSVQSTQPSGQTLSVAVNLPMCVLNEQDPMKKVVSENPGNSDYAIVLRVQKLSGTESIDFRGTHDFEDRFDEALRKVMSQVREDPIVTKVTELAPQITRESQLLREDLRKVIEEPWEI